MHFLFASNEDEYAAGRKLTVNLTHFPKCFSEIVLGSSLVEVNGDRKLSGVNLQKVLSESSTVSVGKFLFKVDFSMKL